MKLAGGILAFLLLTAVLLAALIYGRAQQWPACRGQVVIVKGPAGQPLECVCFEGSLSKCFDPGP
jgi:hypothetical protein